MALWAKSGEPQGHGLLLHMLDVAAVAESILKREPPASVEWISARLKLPARDVPRWVAYCCGLHDIGKATAAFQRKWQVGWRKVKEAGLPAPAFSTDSQHDHAGGAILLREYHSGEPRTVAGLIALCAAGHHGYVPPIAHICQVAPLGELSAWKQVRCGLVEVYRDTLQPAWPSISEARVSLLAWLAGLTAVADWIASNDEWFPFGPRDRRTTEEYYKSALRTAEQALDQLGWPKFGPLVPEPGDTVALLSLAMGKKDGVRPRELQRLGDQLLADCRGPTLLLVEAVMGEGKTELAFLSHLRLQAANGHRGLYVALPTQATGNAMFDRALKFLRACSPTTRLDIQLAHAGAMLHEPITRLRGVGDSKDESVASAAWFAQHRRALLSPYGVGTIDQALYSILNVKHHTVRVWGLSNRVIVLDEVHAYDTYTSTLLRELLRWLRELNCSVVLMSATLPSAKRRELLQAWGVNEPPSTPYPRLIVCTADKTEAMSFCSDIRRVIELEPLDESLSSIAESSVKKLEHGGCGAVILNTVERAQELFLLLREKLRGKGELHLFHARFPADQRRQLEQLVMRRFGGLRGECRPETALLVATQVIEQSLHLDFDFLITDLAPVDLLLQRAGRLHRDELPRPRGHERPRLTVAGLVAEREPDLSGTRWAFVYEPYVLYRTWQVIGQKGQVRIPEDLEGLVESVYNNIESVSKKSDGLVRGPWAEVYKQYQERLEYQRQAALNARIDPQVEVFQAYSEQPKAAGEDEEPGVKGVVRVTTRFEEGDSVLAVPVYEVAEGWATHPDDCAFRPDGVVENGIALRLFRRQVRIGRWEVVRSLKETETPPAFRRHPWLRHLKPLVLGRDGVARIGGLEVWLDPDLGLVYRSIKGI
jgi:CRISPR-associated endonuclease/helicase Cas3